MPQRGRVPGGPWRMQAPHTRTQLSRLIMLMATLVVLLAGCSLPNPFAGHGSPPPTATPVNIHDTIAYENQQPGTTSWIIPDGARATTEIQAYASATSVAPGENLTFYVSVLHDGTPYTLNIYRLGWYGGDGGRLLYSSKLIGQSQGYFDASRGALVGCGSCSVDRSTGLVEANWQPALTLAIPSSWVTGVYFAKFTDIGSKQTYVQFDVRGLPTSTYVVSTSDATYEAYNNWGGYSLYLGPDGTGATRAVKVSFDRPNAGPGLTQGLPYEIDAIRWMERQGYDVSYVSSVDLAEHPEMLLQHKAYINLGHDEYWSKSMRDGIEAARNAGIGLAFLGANDGYWQIRFEADGHGTANHTIVCYKVATNDPLFGRQNALVTVNWRDNLIGRPENALIGIMYSSWSQAVGFPWQVSANASSTLLVGTSLVPGNTYGCDYVGYEWDHVFDNGKTPAGLHILGASRATSHDGTVDVSNTTYYVAPSGALVFASGSIYWSFALDSYRMFIPNGCSGQPQQAQPGMQRLLANVMQTLIARQTPGR